MKTIGAGAFKANCLALMDEVQASREPLLITKRGKPVAKLVAAGEENDSIYSFMRGKGAIRGNVVAPVIPLEDWDLSK